jgi:hypothetical protein
VRAHFSEVTMSAHPPSSSGRSVFLPVLLATIGGFFFLLVLILLTGGFFFYLVLCAGLVGGLATLHWLVWGKLLTDLTAGEREEHELFERARAEEEPSQAIFRR